MWSQRIHAAYPTVDGVLYESSMGAALAVALYERAADAVPATPEFNRALAEPGLATALARIAADLGYRLLWPLPPATP